MNTVIALPRAEPAIARPGIFATFSAKQVLRGLRIWVIHLIKAMVLRNNRFLGLSPPMLSKQLLYDFSLRRFFTVRVRDYVDFCTMTQIYYLNDYGFDELRRAPEIAALYQRLVAAGSVPLILDCGGNIGLASRFFADTYPAAKVVCIEPEPGNVEQARINTEGKPVVFYEAAVGSREASGSIIDTQLGNNAFRVEAGEGGGLDILSINKLVVDNATPGVVPFIIKIDIEGFERELFSENLEWIDRFPVLVIELHDYMLPRRANSNSFLAAVSARDRDFIYIGENVFSLSNTLL